MVQKRACFPMIFAALLVGLGVALAGTSSVLAQDGCQCQSCQQADRCNDCGQCNECRPSGFDHFKLSNNFQNLRALACRAKCGTSGIACKLKHAPKASPPQGCLPYSDERPAELFYNFYAPATCGNVPAAMYPSPIQTPRLVGHTHITYQPLMPHEFMYRHHRFYHHYYNNNSALNRTAVFWCGNPIRDAASGIHNAIKIPR